MLYLDVVGLLKETHLKILTSNRHRLKTAEIIHRRRCQLTKVYDYL